MFKKIQCVFACLWICSQLPLLAQEVYKRESPLTFSSVKKIDKESIRQMAANNLAEVLKYQLNIEIENSPDLGGSRIRTADLNSRHFKILVDGIPLSSPDMFGSHIDLSSIPMYDVDFIEIFQGAKGTEYGSGSFAGLVNVVRTKIQDKNAIRFSLQEESTGNEYNLKSGNGAKGRHLQNLGIHYSLLKNLQLGINISRDQFQGYQGKYKGPGYLAESSYQRGYEWSPRTSRNITGQLNYQTKNMRAFYQFSTFKADLTFYGHNAEQEFRDNVLLPLFTAEDFSYLNNSSKHQLNFKGTFRGNATYSLDLSLQEAASKRNIRKVNTASHEALTQTGLRKLYASNTFYSRAMISKPLLPDKLRWELGYEMDHTRGNIAVEPGTYLSSGINKGLLSLSVFTQFQWHLSEKLAIQPGLRLSRYHQPKIFAAPALSLNYNLNEHNNLKLILEKTDRSPNHRELFSYLENEFNLLEGNPDLKPETGKSVLLSWQNTLKNTGETAIKTTLSSSFKQLRNRIIISSASLKIPTQDAYRYTNLNEYYGWLNQIDIDLSSDRIKANLGISLLGTRGDDIGSSKAYDRYLFHLESNSSIAYHFKNNYRINANYRFIGKQSIYSFERDGYSMVKNRVLNHMPAAHLLDVHTGTSFFAKRLDAAIGVKNLLNTTALNYTAADGQEHYRGDLRPQYIGYGRSFYLGLTYRISQ